ncbi:hypothetical protein AO721_11980 [Aeromonas veronii]|uniref:DUF6862 domain-containing protein n=1 Tax=Aeromonas veronii TaxID=654 RepID=UPI0007183DD9|nr:hypothetical protein [Aeromonas veronii]KRV63682.1 hypothetical protein AO728_08630 [Aeromonas veronii]KRV71209.1 hypothetical protein AO719_10285 [Aeromonas veronii]KRV82257.1 hypothetical protein AO739_12185 [Aeromonas veronii]KRV82582.1 hypothetical protein AO721_11980 [Aeromonas veronii]
MHQFECIHPYNACKQFDSGLLQKVGVLIVMANWIGDQGIKFDAANSPLAEAGKIAAHGVTSGAIAEITGGKFAAGAAGGAMSELASSWSSQVFSNTEHQVALNKVLGGLAAVAVTGDQNQFDTGADRAETIYRYNYLSHKDKSEQTNLRRAAEKGELTAEQKTRLAELNLKDVLSDESLLKACMHGSASECQTARQDALAKADTYPNLGYQYPKESLAGYQQIDRLLAGTTEEAIQTQRMYDGLVASYERIGMSAENAKTLVGYQLGAIYVFGGVAGAKSMSAVEKGLANSAGQRYQETAKTSMAEKIKANIAESQLARESSNFGIHIAKSDQIRWGYAADEWGFVTLPVGSKVYGGIPGQSSYYTSWDTLSSAGFSRELIFKSLQVLPHPEFGYRPKMGVYEVMNELSVPSGQVIANPLLGPGGGNQYFIKDFGNQLKLIDTINLDK